MNPTGLIVDASVALKWFSLRGEEDAELAIELVGNASLRTTSLGYFEVGARLSRGRESTPEKTRTSLEKLQLVCGRPVELEPADFLRTAEIADQHSITFYDASYVAIAERMGRRVISADRDLLDPGLALSLAEVVGN